MYVDWGSDGCPNNCEYCRTYGYSCIYEDDDSPLKVKPYECCACGKKLDGSQTYSFKDRDYCSDCFGKYVGW